MDAPVQGNSCQSKDARVHGEKNDEVHDFAHHGAEHPSIQSVDGGLKGHAENNKTQICYPEVEDEHVGGFGIHLPVAKQNREDQRVSHGADQENDRKRQRNDHRLRFPRGGVPRGEIHIYAISIHI